MSLGLPGAVTTTNVLDAKLVGLPDNRPALTTVSICAVSADAKTSTVAPWVSCVASSEDPAKSKSTLLPGLSDVNRSLIFVNAGLSDAAAKTPSFPELGEDVGDADEDGFGLHPTRAASRIVAIKPARTRNRRMDETLARRRSRSMAWAEESGGGAGPGAAAQWWPNSYRISSTSCRRGISPNCYCPVTSRRDWRHNALRSQASVRSTTAKALVSRPGSGFNVEHEEVMAVEVLVTGGDTELGRTVAEGFHDAGHKVTLVGAPRDDLEIAAKELDADAIVCDTTDPVSLESVRGLFPHHLDTIINVPAPSWDSGDPRTYSLADTSKAWGAALDATVLSAVLTVQAGGCHLRSGGC